MRWWSRLSLRGRLVLLGTGGLVLALTIAGISLVLAMSYALRRTVDLEADRTASSIIAMIEEDGTLPKPVPVPAGQVAQVLDRDGHVQAGSTEADLLTPLLRPDELHAARQGQRITLSGDRALRDQPLRAVARTVGPPDNRRTVVVAVPIGDFNTSVGLLRTTLLVTYPVLMLILAGVGWRVVGAALRPVEQLRASAERITGAATEERLPVPLSRDEIHRLAVTLNDMLDRLAGSRARQRAFVADAAHELRNPLASMRVQLEVAQRLGDWATVGGDLLLDVERLSRLADDLLLLARADEGDMRRRQVEPVELRSLLASLAERPARVPVELAAGDGPVWIEADPDALRRIMLNLVDNALRHARSVVRLDAVADGDTVLVTVTDDGAGIPPADRERVFDRFRRLDDARARDAGGAGLGLPIVRELVRRHGGTVHLADAEPGVRAEVRLPEGGDPC